jgi:hypothetical protein
VKIIWRIIHKTFGLEPPKNVTNLLGNGSRVFLRRILFRLESFEPPEMTLYLTNKQNTLIPMATHWMCMWSYLKQEEQWKVIDSRCNHLKMVARDLFN